MAPKQDPNQRQFHWIHKDVDSSQLSRSDGLEATHLLQFVQRNRSNTARRRRRVSRTSRHDFIAFETGSRMTAQAHRVEDEPHNSEYKATPSSMHAMQSRWRLHVPINDVTSGSGIDPFASAVVPISTSMWSLLQYTRASILNGAGGYKLEVFSKDLKPMMDMYQAAVEYTFHNLIHYKHILYPILAAFSRRVQRLSDNALGQLQSPEQYTALATQAVRTSLADNSHNRQIMSSIATGVHFLICAAGLAGQAEETDIHINAFLRFVPFLDTKTLVGYWELDLANSWDIVNSVTTGKAPITRVAASEPGPMPAARLALVKEELQQLSRRSRPRSQVDPKSPIGKYQRLTAQNRYDLMQNPSEDLNHTLGTGLAEAIDIGLIHSRILPIVRSILDCLTVAHVIWTAPEIATKEDSSWLCRKSRAALHNLLSMTGAKQIGQLTYSGQLAECLRRTLIIVLMSAQYRVMYMSREILAARLKEALLLILTHNHEPSPAAAVTTHSLLLWMLITGYWTALDLVHEAWFAQMAIYVAVQKLDYKEFDDLDKLMNRYLYARTVQHGALRRLAVQMNGQQDIVR